MCATWCSFGRISLSSTSRSQSAHKLEGHLNGIYCINFCSSHYNLFIHQFPSSKFCFCCCCSPLGLSRRPGSSRQEEVGYSIWLHYGQSMNNANTFHSNLNDRTGAHIPSVKGMKMTSGQFQMRQTSGSTVRTNTMNKVAYFSFSLFFI